MNTEGLTEVAVQEAQPVVEQAPAAAVVETAPAAPAIVVPGLDDSSLYIHRELSQPVSYTHLTLPTIYSV